MRLTTKMSVMGAALALALVALPPVHATPAAAATEVVVTTPAELIDAFDSVNGEDYVVALAAAIEVTPADGHIIVPSGENVTLDLYGFDLDIEAAESHAGIEVTTGSTLRIIDSYTQATPGTLTVTGGPLAAGIGGSSNQPGGTVEVHSGEVIAHSPGYGAGIGGGVNGDAGIITISGGTVTATSGNDAAGIGGGTNGKSGLITITGGTVTATGGRGGAGIGGGGASGGSNEGNITITGGTVIATGGAGGGSGIGSAHGRSHGPVTITGGTVTATGGSGEGSTGPGTGIGHAMGHVPGDPLIDPMPITLSGGTITAVAGAPAPLGEPDQRAAAIGGSTGRAGAAVTITGDAVVTARAPGSVTAIGEGTGRASDYPFGSLTIDASAGLTIPAGSALRIPPGATASNAGELEMIGDLRIMGEFTNTGELFVDLGAALVNEGSIANHGSMLLDGEFTNTSTGSIENIGFIGLLDESVNAGHITNSGALAMYGNTTNTGSFTNNADVMIGETFTNTGQFINSDTGFLEILATFTNDSVMQNSGHIGVFDTTLVNNGAIFGPGTINDLTLVTVHNFKNVFDLNGGSGLASSELNVLAPSFADAGLELPTAPTREGYDFVGWAAAADGSGATLVDTLVLGSEAATLTWYAQWALVPPPPGTDSGSGESDETLAATGSDPAPAQLAAGFASLLLAGGAAVLVLARRRAVRQL